MSTAVPCATHLRHSNDGIGPSDPGLARKHMLRENNMAPPYLQSIGRENETRLMGKTGNGIAYGWVTR